MLAKKVSLRKKKKQSQIALHTCVQNLRLLRMIDKIINKSFESDGSCNFLSLLKTCASICISKPAWIVR